MGDNEVEALRARVAELEAMLGRRPTTTYVLTLTKRGMRRSLAWWWAQAEASPEKSYLSAMLSGFVEIGESEQHTENAEVAQHFRERFAGLVSVTEIPYGDECPF